MKKKFNKVVGRISRKIARKYDLQEYENQIIIQSGGLYKHTYKTPCIYLDMGNGHTEIKRFHGLSLINDECWGEYITALLLNWEKTKNKIELKLTDLVAKAIKEKTKETENIINYNNSLLKTLKGEN